MIIKLTPLRIQGSSASITVTNGSVYSGIFVGFTMEQHETSYLLKMVRQVSGPKTEANGVHETSSDYIGVGSDHAMSFDTKDVVDLGVEGVSFGAQDRGQNGASRK